jgi:predicted N-acetyltransferase YhbS
MNSISCQLAAKNQKKLIQRFYKNNHYSAAFIGNDQCFVLTAQQQIIASVIISEVEQQYFLHALVVNEQYRRQGLGMKLVNTTQTAFNNLVCFAEPDVGQFYTRLGFTASPAAMLCNGLQHRYRAYQAKHPQLAIYYYHKP